MRLRCFMKVKDLFVKSIKREENMKRLTSVVLAIVISILSGSMNIGYAIAEGYRAIAISPTSQKIVLMPGEVYEGGFIVANPRSATEDLNYLVTLKPFFPVSTADSKDDYGNADYVTKTNMNMIVDWATISNPVGRVEPNGEQVVSFTIDVPEDAPAGGQYMGLLVRENPDVIGLEDSLAVTEIMQMAHIVYAEVAGETRQEGDILENNIPSFVMNNELAATSMVKNNGNIHTDAEAALQVWPLFSDEEICTNEENASSIFVMPGTERYHTETCQLPSVGIFRAKQTVKIFGETSIVEKTIIVCPIWLLFIIIFVIFALIFYFVARARTRKKAAKK